MACSPAASSTFGLSNVYDGKPGTVWQPGSASTTTTLTVDVERLASPGFESGFSGGLPVSWSGAATGGTISSTTVAGEFRTGQACKIAAGGGAAAYIYQDVTVGSGESVQLSA